MTNLPRIRKQTNPETWLYTAVLVGYPKPGVGLVVDLYQPSNPADAWMVFATIDKEAGR
jgi:hypothetical protein